MIARMMMSVSVLRWLLGSSRPSFGCRLCSSFDTRVKSDEGLDEPVDDHPVADGQSDGKNELDDLEMDAGGDWPRKRVSDIAMAVDSGCQLDSGSSTAYEGDSDDDDSTTAYDGDSDSDVSSVYHPDDDGSDTDDDCGAGSEETRAILYRHFTITIISNETSGKPNVVFMKATLLHAKGEDNNPRV